MLLHYLSLILLQLSNYKFIRPLYQNQKEYQACFHPGPFVYGLHAGGRPSHSLLSLYSLGHWILTSAL